MSKKNNEAENGSMLGLGEISTIRNILMGQQINDFESRFKEMEMRINKMEDGILNKIQKLKELLEERNSELSNEMTQQNASLVKRLEKEVNDLERKLEKATNRERKELGRMLAGVSKKLLGE